MTRPKYPPTGRYQVRAAGEDSRRRRLWSVVDSKTNKTIRPAGPLAKAHSVADRLNREEARTP